MTLLLQTDSGLNVENAIIEDAFSSLGKSFLWATTTLERITMEDLKTKEYDKNSVPIGSIEFIEFWLKKYHNKKMTPIEVPECLRTQYFLKREYNICTGDKIPATGRYFIKNIEKLKQGTYCGNAENYADYRIIRLDQKYVVSEEVNIESEWRAYVINNKLENIANYDGNPLIYPDSTLVKQAIARYSIDSQCPKSYTIDLGINESGTFIIEVHPFTAVGLYCALWGASLINAYIDGIEYYKNFGATF